jgi:tetratricopeptide (TPR) repeat protein
VDHPGTLTSMANLALTYRNQGRWKEAKELEVQVMETRKRVLGAEHPSTLTSMANLASTFWDQGQWKEAEELEVQVMETRKRVLGSEHPSTLTSMANLASTFWNQGRWKEAEELFMQVMETFKMVLGAEHPSTLTSIANLASTFWNQGRWKEAEELFLQVMETFMRVLGAEHPDTLTSMTKLALTYRNQGRLKEAEELDVQVMETRKRMLGAEHPSTLTSMADLASTYRNQGRWKEAEELEVQVMETRKRVLSSEHLDTPASMANPASTYRNQGRWKEAEEPDVSDTASTEHPSTFWSDQAGSTNPSSLSQIAVDMEQVTDSRSPITFYRYKEPAIEHKPDKRDDDIQSVESIPDDVDSLAESTSGMVHYRQAAVNYIVKIFTADSELVALYQEATHSMDKAKFVENHRRLLKRFFLDLRSEGHTPSQKLAVGFLRSRSKRIHISSEIRRLVMPSDNTVREKINIMLKQKQGSLSLLDRFLDENSAAQLAPTNTVDETSDGELIVQPRVRDNADTASKESEDSGNDKNMSGDESEVAIEDDSTLSKLATTAEFLTSGRSFGLYKENLRAFLRPVHKAAHLQNLHSGIQARRTEGSELFSLNYDVSFARGFNSAIQDICKRGIEHIAGCQLSWWPLSGPEDKLEAGHIRVYSMSFVSSKPHSKLKQSLY